MTMLSDGMLLGVGSAFEVPLFVASATGYASGGGTLTINKPTGTLLDDDLYAFVWGESFTSLSLSGWTSVFTGLGSGIDFAVFHKQAGPSEPSSYSFSGAENRRSGVIASYRGGVGAIDVQGTGISEASSATATASSISATKPGALLSSFGRAGGGQALVTTPPAGMTDRGVQSNVGLSSALYELSPSFSGASGSKSLVWSSAGTTGGWLMQIY